MTSFTFIRWIPRNYNSITVSKITDNLLEKFKEKVGINDLLKISFGESFSEIVKNSIDSMSDKRREAGVRLEKKVRLSIKISANDEIIRITIKDSGKGFPAHLLQNGNETDYCVNLNKDESTSSKIRSAKRDRKDQLGGEGLGLTLLALFLKRFSNAQLTIGNNKSAGAYVKLTIPTHPRLNNEKSSSDCIEKRVSYFIAAHPEYAPVVLENKNEPVASGQEGPKKTPLFLDLRGKTQSGESVSVEDCSDEVISALFLSDSENNEDNDSENRPPKNENSVVPHSIFSPKGPKQKMPTVEKQIEQNKNGRKILGVIVN